MGSTLRAGVVGLTGIGARPPIPAPKHGWGISMPHSHASAYHFVEDTELVAVCDLRQEAIDEFDVNWRSHVSEVNSYIDYREMIDRENLDLISVVTSDHVHTQIVIDAAEAGVKGIACEKPIATTLADADRMIEAVEKAGIPMLIDHVYRWWFPWADVGKLIDDGAIGDVVRIMCNQGGPRAMLFRNGTHVCDTINWFSTGNPTAVYAVAEKGFEDYGPRYASDGGHDPDTDPALSIMIEYDNDVRAFWNACKTMPGRYIGPFDIWGTEGRIHLTNDYAVLYDDPEEGLRGRELTPTHYTQGHIAGLVTELVGLIRDGGEPSCDGRQARQALEVLLAALQSAAGGNVRVQLPITDA